MDSQIQYLTRQYLQDVSDSASGGPSSSPTAAAFVLGQLGMMFKLNQQDIANLSNPTYSPALQQGEYQYVQRDSTDVLTAVQGNVAFWSDAEVYKVTAAFGGCIAGVFLGANPLAGQYGFIQRSGIAGVLFATSPTKASPAACDLVLVVTQASKGVGDILADATQPTWAQVGKMLGKTYTAPVGAAVSLVELDALFRNS